MKTINLSIIKGGVTWIENTDSCSVQPPSMLLGDYELALSTMLKARDSNPEAVIRQNIFHYCDVLNLKDFVDDVQKWNGISVRPTDFYESYFLMSEFIISDFKSFFSSDEQYFSWMQEISETVLQYAQSIESFFVNTNGTLNYSLLVKSVKIMISSGVKNPVQELCAHTGEKMHRQPYFARYQTLLKGGA
jgi:hypothetical protein